MLELAGERLSSRARNASRAAAAAAALESQERKTVGVSVCVSCEAGIFARERCVWDVYLCVSWDNVAEVVERRGFCGERWGIEICFD